MQLFRLADYSGAVYEFLKRNEGEPSANGRVYVYADSVGIPTIGIGVNLQELVGAQDQAPFNSLLAMLGLNLGGLSGAAAQAEQQYESRVRVALQSQYPGAGSGPNNAVLVTLNAILNARRNDPVYDPAVSATFVTDFSITPQQSRQLFEQILPQYESELDDWLRNDVQTPAIVDGLLTRNSAERLALLSLKWNQTPGERQLLGPRLADALRHDDRAEAWYQIRYQSNGGDSSSGDIANRRYRESDLFGLYDNPAGPQTKADAKQAWRVYTRHKAQIEGYENDDAPTSGQPVPIGARLRHPQGDLWGSLPKRFRQPDGRESAECAGGQRQDHSVFLGTGHSARWRRQ